jgi:GTPase
MPEGPRRAGLVALLGRPNVGKSTLLNAALGQALAPVSATPQTTRDALLGVVHHGQAELAVLDTPGLHRPKTELGRVMNNAAREAVRSADVVVLVVEVPEAKPRPGGAPRTIAPHPGDRTLLADIGDKKTVLVVNKVDRVHDKGLLLPFMEAFAAMHPFGAIVPVSAIRGDGVHRVLDEVAALCPEGAWQHGEDDLTDRPTRFFAAEYVREQILRATQKEVPHASAVAIEQFVEPPGGGTLHVDATIVVERPGQKRILIGAGGAMLKKIGTAARLRLEELTERKVNLKLWVKVEPDWRESRRALQDLGYGKAPSS